MRKGTSVCIFGGTGFIGQYIVRKLSNAGYTVKILTRAPSKQHTPCDYTDDQSIAAAVQGCDIVINTIGILFEKGVARFDHIHTHLPAVIAGACRDNNIGTFVHISALGIEECGSKYSRSKLDGETAILENFADTIILRPSIVFGKEDNFFNMFAQMAKILPALPLIGGGKTQFQPVFVDDVAQAVMNAITQKDAKGKIYELGGPDVKSFKELLQIMLHHTQQKRALISLPFFVARMEALLLELMPKPLLTRDQITSLRSDHIVHGGALTLKDLNVEATSMDLVLPEYLAQYKAK